ncbi:MAG: hypothetical protein LUE63_00225 [Lachnospiraceae bacterium]|nr:hypothetical protein [Lachnospiraceae bacterium]
MLIGDWDISEAGARQWTVSFSSCDISSNSEWIEGSPIPVLFRNTTSFKTLTIKLMLNGSSREEILLARSDILARLLDPCKLTLDHYSHYFYGIMTKHSAPSELSMQRFHTLTFEFDCYEYSDEQTVSMSGVTQTEVINSGNILTPLVLEITPQEDLDTLEIQGVCRKLSITSGPLEEQRNTRTVTPILAADGTEILGTTDDAEETPILASDISWENDLPVIFTGLKAGVTITISGENGLISASDSDEIPEVELWELPTLMSGSNVIYVNSTAVDIVLRYCPRYM